MTRWRKSSHSFSNGNCVEVASCSCLRVLVRDSTAPAGPRLVFGRQAWEAFTSRLRVTCRRGDIPVTRS